MGDASKKGTVKLPAVSLSRASSVKIVEKQGAPTGKESKNSIKEGWLTKQGNYIRNWRPRWFQLKEGILYYYKEPSLEVRPTNFFVLSGATVQTNSKNGFDIIFSNGERRSMQASSDEDRDAWVAALRETIRKQAQKKLEALQSRANPGSSASSQTGSSDSLASARSINSVVPRMPREKRISPDDFNFLKVLGKGNYGKVMLATLKTDTTNQYYAIKVIKKSALIDDESLEHVLAENRVLQQIDHPFLVKLHYSFQTPERLYFVMEYASGGELFFHIGREKQFSETRVRFYAGEILLALHYLHSKGVVYRDMKLENILLDATGHVKITDFGLCKEGIRQEDTTSTFCGTPEYLAPEILEEENYGRSVDWWALGVVLYEMMVGKPPFGPANNMEKLFHNILHQPVVYPPFLSEQAKSLLEALLCRDSSQRLGCGKDDGEEIIRHPFFAGIDFDKLLNKVYQPPFRPKVDDILDTRNFDKEFTNMPAQLTPENDTVEGMKKDFEQFTFYTSK